MAQALYIHWPFCLAKCPYCDFNSHVRERVEIEAWQRALLIDMRHEAALAGGEPLESVFFGGGTPSLMPPALVGALLDEAERLWGFAQEIEITLEANPSSVEASKFADLAEAGVNRVSLGLQALDDATLRFLGRLHDAREGLAALETAQAVFQRVSFDLIYARPEQTPEQWEAELRRALGFGTGHLSLYQLTIEPGTRFATDVARKRFQPLDADRAAALYRLTEQSMAAAAMPGYEISNYARAGYESRHNLTYWRYGDYAGIGPGAHGRRNGMRTLRHRKPENFLSAIARNGHGLAEDAPLSATEAADEALVMGLRLAEGIDSAAIARRFGIDTIVDWARVDRLVGSGHLHRAGTRIALTAAGRLVLDHILGEIAATDPRVSQPLPPEQPVAAAALRPEPRT
jgi:oxygen-independent coproporphyrinogen-3 oxidase